MHDLRTYFDVMDGTVKAVDGVSFGVHRGGSIGIVGESGCGKSTLARTLIGLQKPTSGGISFQGRSLVGLDEDGWRQVRREIQMVFQDPLASLDPRMTVG